MSERLLRARIIGAEAREPVVDFDNLDEVGPAFHKGWDRLEKEFSTIDHELTQAFVGGFQTEPEVASGK